MMNSPLCGPAVAFLILAILVYCAVAIAGQAADNAEETWMNMHKEENQ